MSDCTPVEERVWGSGVWGLVGLPVLKHLVNAWHGMND